jgi:hypothetical protein
MSDMNHPSALRMMSQQTTRPSASPPNIYGADPVIRLLLGLRRDESWTPVLNDRSFHASSAQSGQLMQTVFPAVDIFYVSASHARSQPSRPSCAYT